MTPEQEKSGLHATTVQLQGRGVMLMGKSGSGKTETALTLIERAISRGEQGCLVADDRTILMKDSEKLIASVPEQLRGGVEIRGAGLFTVAYVKQTPLDLVVSLVSRDEAERYPDGRKWQFEGVEVPRLLLPALSSNGDSNALSRAVEASLFYKPWP